MKEISFNFELISLEKSFEERPERSIDEEVKKFKEYIQERRVKWTEEEKIEFLESGALEGTKQFLFFDNYNLLLDSMLQKISHVELHADNTFQENFASTMNF